MTRVRAWSLPATCVRACNRSEAEPPMTSPIAMAAQFALLTTAAVALSAPPAAAQAGPIQAGKGSKAPIDIVADQAEFFNIECRYVYTGSVEALQDTARLRSDVMIAHQEVNKKGSA